MEKKGLVPHSYSGKAMKPLRHVAINVLRSYCVHLVYWSSALTLLDGPSSRVSALVMTG